MAHWSTTSLALIEVVDLEVGGFVLPSLKNLNYAC